MGERYPDVFWVHLQSTEAAIAAAGDGAPAAAAPRSLAGVESVSISDFAARFGGE